MAYSFRHIPRFLGCALCLCALCLSLSSAIAEKSFAADVITDAYSVKDFPVPCEATTGYNPTTWVETPLSQQAIAWRILNEKLNLNKKTNSWHVHLFSLTYWTTGNWQGNQERQITQYFLFQTSGIQSSYDDFEGSYNTAIVYYPGGAGVTDLEMDYRNDSESPYSIYPIWLEVNSNEVYSLNQYSISSYTGSKKPYITVMWSDYPSYWTDFDTTYCNIYVKNQNPSTNYQNTLLSTIIEIIRDKLNEVDQEIQVDTSGLESSVSTQTSTLQSSITSQTSSINSQLSSGFSGVESSISSMNTSLGTAVSTAQSAITGAVSTAQSAITGGLSSLGQTLSGISSALPTFGKGQYGNGSGVSISTQTKNNFETLLQTKAPVCYFVMVNDEIGRLSSTYSSASLASNSNLYIDLPIPYAGNVRFDLKESFLGQAVGNVYLYNGIRFALTLFLVVMIVYGGSRLALSIAFGGSDD